MQNPSTQKTARGPVLKMQHMNPYLGSLVFLGLLLMVAFGLMSVF